MFGLRKRVRELEHKFKYPYANTDDNFKRFVKNLATEEFTGDIQELIIRVNDLAEKLGYEWQQPSEHGEFVKKKNKHKK